MSVQDLFQSAVDDAERERGAAYRKIVAQGGICPRCGSHIKSWPWADRIRGVPEPPHRVVPHTDDCPALLEATS